MIETPNQPGDEAENRALVDVISQVLELVRLDGAIFLRAEFRSPWAYVSSSAADIAQAFDSGSDRVILFHIVADGNCWISLEDNQRLWLERGDVVVLPYADQHTVGGLEPAEPVSVATLFPPPPWDELARIDYGGDGARTEIVCGYLRCGDLLFDPVLRALPSIFTVRPTPGPAATWVSASVQYALEASQRGVKAQTATQRLPELLFVEVLRLYLQDDNARLGGWLAALQDPIVGPAIAALHAEPARDWTVAELAKQVATSKSVLDDRFRQLVGRPPIRYLTDWRLQLAGNLLTTTELGVGEIGAQVGYRSEEAFSRAFKRGMGESPTRWRDRSHAISAPPTTSEGKESSGQNGA